VTLANPAAYIRTAHPVLSWSAPGSRWGPFTYTVNVDGAPVGQTGAGTLQVPAPLSDGPHVWSVTAGNPAGLTSASRSARLFVDTTAPKVGAKLSGARRPAARLTLRLNYRDAPPAGLPARDASGVASLTIHWGDGTITHVKPGTHRILHSYRRAGRYRITITVLDRAGNRTSAVKRVKIAKPPAKKRHK
jgi:hypothetical protein